MSRRRRPCADERGRPSDADHPESPRFPGQPVAAAPQASLAPAVLADEGPPGDDHGPAAEVRRAICLAPQYVAEELLRAEGFTDVRYVQANGGERQLRSHAASRTSPATSPAGRLSSGCRRADHGAGGRASRVLRAVRQRADPQPISDLKGKRVGIQEPGSSAPVPGRPMAAYIGLDPARGHRLGHDRRSGNAMELFADGQDRRLPRLPARAAGAARPQDRPRDPQHAPSTALVAVLLLHAARQRRVRPRASGRHQARAARHPQGRRPLRRRAGAGRAQLVDGGFTAELRLRAPDAGDVPTTAGASSTPRTRCGSTRSGCTRRA